MLEWIISSAVLLAAVIAVRYALRGRLRPGVQYAMWAIVLVRLLVPVSFGSGAYSAGTAAAALEQTPAVQAVLTPSMDYDAAYSQVAREYAGRGLDVSELAPRQQQAMDREIRALQRPTAVQVLQWVWLGGMAAMALTLTGTNLRLYIRLRRSRRELTREGRMPVYVTEAVDTPCLFGLVRPAVYLTPEAAGDDVTRQHSVAHELTHLRHGDHVWSLLRCVCLAVHWYDPLVWWAAVLSRRDAELACDDATLRRLGEEQRAAYGRTLVRMTCRRPGNLLVTATTMTDGAGGIRERIRCIAKRPRTTVYTAVVLVLVVAAAAGCAFTGSARKDAPRTPTQAISQPDNSGRESDWVAPVQEPYEPRPGMELPPEGAVPLTAGQLAQVNEYCWAWVQLADGGASYRPINGFFRCHYADPSQIDLSCVLKYSPQRELISDPAEYEALKQLPGWYRGMDSTLADSPTPVWRYSGATVDGLLTEYAGITRADLKGIQTDVLLYRPENDAYYNFTSDAGPGEFHCDRGYVVGDQVLLYDDSEWHLFDHSVSPDDPAYCVESIGRVLTLHKTAEGRYVIYSLLSQK